MKAILAWARDVGRGWNAFWFQPQTPQTLGLIRLLAGCMLFYTHLVWSLDLQAFLGDQGWLPTEVARSNAVWIWTPLFHIHSPVLLWTYHLLGLAVIAMAAVGWKSRWTTKLAWLVALSYCHRLQGSLFGLDQVNAMLAMYLMLGPSGDAFSLDRWLAARRGEAPPPPKWATTVAIRLIQLHLCVIYLFGGLGKTQGALWWDGTAVWYAVANFEYQSLEMTWLAHWPWFVALLSHATVFWETFYCALVWPRLTRPLALGMAVAVHGGIALFLGMITFGLAMLIANLSFVSPQLVARLFGRWTFRVTPSAAG